MRRRARLLCFFGTRPEAIKMAPVVARLKEERRFQVSLAVSAQHRDMLDQVLDDFGLKAQYDLNLMKENQSLADITSGVLEKFGAVLEKTRPDLVLVHGDTTTTLAGALASFYKEIPVGHVEAGLRTSDPSRPFPEEMNRRLTDSLCRLYFPPTPEAKKNLLKENLNARNMFVTGNTVIDALLQTARRDRPLQQPVLKNRLGPLMRESHPLVLLTAHRRENFGAPFKNAFSAIRDLSFRFPLVHWVYPVHPNPNVKGPAKKALAGRPNIHLVDPVGYSDLVAVLKRSRLVVTDSGGLQEEAPALGIPVLVLRDVTERPEAVRAGTVCLVGCNRRKIIGQVSRLLTDPEAYRRMARAVNPYGDGQASDRIAAALRWHFGFSNKKPMEFHAR